MARKKERKFINHMHDIDGFSKDGKYLNVSIIANLSECYKFKCEREKFIDLENLMKNKMIEAVVIHKKESYIVKEININNKKDDIEYIIEIKFIDQTKVSLISTDQEFNSDEFMEDIHGEFPNIIKITSEIL